MASRTGRPRTGRKPNFIVRMNPEHAAAARQSARDAGKQVGQWLEEAITEKREREQGAEDVNKAGC
jgi:predicted HicB family RNase H-like nuclease